MKIRKIYVDMDGVLADFDRGVSEILHLPVHKQGTQTKEMDDELWEAAKAEGNFYYKLMPIEGALESLSVLLGEYGDKVEILTGIPKANRGITTAVNDKKSWLRNKYGFDMAMNIVYRAQKVEYVTGKEDILVDDYEKNIREWEEAGGTGILFTDWKNTLKMIKNL